MPTLNFDARELDKASKVGRKTAIPYHVKDCRCKVETVLLAVDGFA